MNVTANISSAVAKSSATGIAARSRRSAWLASLLLLSGVAGAQPPEPSRIGVSALGPQVGELVPQFSLPDQSGARQTRASILGPAGAMLVSVRSADW